MSNGLPYIHISTMHHTLIIIISIFWWIRKDYIVWHLICCIYSKTTRLNINNDMIHNSNGIYVRMIEEIIHYLLFIGRFSTHLLVLEKRKDFLTLNGHGISDARCSLWISIFFHTIFSTFAIPPSLSFFPICLPGHRISDIVKYIIICCVFVCFFRIQNTKWYDVKLPLLKYFDSIRNIKWWNSNIFTWWYGFLFHSICVRNSNRMKKSRKGKK